VYNKIFRIVFSLLVIFLISGAPVVPVLAQTNSGDSFTLNQIGESEIQLHGPFDSRTIVFGLPAEWQPSGDSKLDLNLGVIYNAVAGAPASNGGTLTVVFNRAVVSVIQLSQLGEVTQNVAIPASALAATRADGRMELTLTLDSGIDCDVVSQNFMLVVHDTSRFTISHKVVTPDLNLVKFPRPLFQDTFNIDNAVVVIPDQPTASELQGAMTVAAGLGNLTGHKLILELTTITQLTADQKGASNLIMVGKSTSLPILSTLNLPLTISRSGFQVEAGGEDNGVITMVNSPWAASKVILAVSGNTDIGVVKAAQAVTTGVLQPNSSPNLAIVKDIKPALNQATVALDQTLSDLGYDITKLGRIGVNTASFTFTVPPGQTITTDAYFDLIMRHTALLDFTRSGLVVSLNGQPIGSSSLTADKGTADSEHYKITLPPALVVTGKNRLDVSVELRPVFNCNTPNFDDVYVLIFPESSLHLPLQPSHVELTSLFSLDLFPAPFVFDPSLNTLAFVLPHNNLVAWNSGLQLASFLGDRAKGSLTTPHAFYADGISQDDLTKYNLLLIGQPSQLPIAKSLNSSLPMPFQDGSDVVQESKMQVLFSISPSVPMGYIEILPSPWSQGNNILAVFGNTTQGVNWAGNSLIDPTQRSRLSGNFAAITSEQIITADTRLATIPNLAIPNGSVAVGTPSTLEPIASPSPPAQRPLGVLIASVGAAGLALLILVIALFRGWSNSHKRVAQPEKEI
jgi:cellulose synthase subunit